MLHGLTPTPYPSPQGGGETLVSAPVSEVETAEHGGGQGDVAGPGNKNSCGAGTGFSGRYRASSCRERAAEDRRWYLRIALPLVGRGKGWGYATSVLRHRFRDTHRDGLISNDLLTSGDRLLQRRAGAYLALLPLHSSIMDRRDERE